MSNEDPTPPQARGPRISEDWAATVIGLAILVLILAGVITKGVWQ